MIYRVLIATRSFGSTSSRPWEILREGDCETIVADMNADKQCPADKEHSGQISEDRLIELLQDADGAIIGVLPFTERVMASAPRLKVVCFHGVGVDHIDLQAAARLGIQVANCPGTNDQAVADLTIGLMIAVARKIPAVHLDLRQGKWGRASGSELWRKTLSLIGYGYIGRAVARRALGFEMEVLAYDPFVRPEQVTLAGVQLVSFDEALSHADFISLHAVLNEQTRNLIGASQFEKMKPGAYLINTARGGLVDEAALFNALSSGRIAGAGLDAFVKEPPGDNPLLQLSNVVATPHIGSHTSESTERVGILAAQNIVQALHTGQPLHRVV